MTQWMQTRASEVKPGDSQGKVLRVIPIVGRSHDLPRYAVLDSTNLSRVKIGEISAAGSVPSLMVQNDLDVPLYLMDGQALVGAKQNRILNTDVFVPANSTLKIPVSCVEHGRWSYKSQNFAPSKAASHRIRSGKSERVRESLKRTGRHDADQGAVWDEVQMSLAAADAVSPTAALADAYTRRDADLRSFRSNLSVPPDAVGLAVFQGQNLAGLDLFDRHSTLLWFWESLIDSYAIDLMSQPIDPNQSADSTEAMIVRQTLDRATEGKWEQFNSPGLGADWRLDDPQLCGSALVVDEQCVVHLQLFPKSTRRAGIMRRPVGRDRPVE